MKSFKLLAVAALLLTAAGCAALQSLTLKKPTVTYQDFHFKTIGFNGVTLLFDFLVDNPNNTDVSANSYSYDFAIGGTSFVKGESDAAFLVKAKEQSLIQVPVTLNFREVFQAFGSLEYQDELPWELNTVVQVDVPAVGVQSLPVSAKGRIPLIKAPSFKMDGIDMNTFSLAGADLVVKIRVVNPNAFALRVQNAAYNLQINGQTWLDTRLSQTIEVAPKSDVVLNAPVRIDMRNFGVTAYRILTREEAFEYRLTGSGKVGMDLPGFGDLITLPFDLKGNYSIKGLD